MLGHLSLSFPKLFPLSTLVRLGGFYAKIFSITNQKSAIQNPT
jgi:hypothetical protein